MDTPPYVYMVLTLSLFTLVELTAYLTLLLTDSTCAIIYH